MSTPGRRRSLRALARRIKANRSRVRHGKSAIVAGKKLKPSTYRRKYGMPRR